MLVRIACSFRCALSNSQSSLEMLVSGRDIVHYRSTACAHDACCKTFLPCDRLALRARDTVCTEILKQELSILNCSIIFCMKHSVICLLVTARAYYRRVLRLRMPDCLITLVDQCADSEG